MDAESQKPLAQPDRNEDAQSNPPRPALAPGKELASLVVFSAIFLAALVAFYSFVWVPNHNIGGPILNARLSQALGDSASDYISYFPPAENVWYGLAALLSDLTSITADRVAVLMTGLAMLFSTGLAYRIRKLTVGVTPVWFALSAIFLAIMPIVVKNIFGLTIHLVVMGLWPYLNLRLCDPDDTRIGWKLRSVVGLWLGATLTLRYLYSLIVLMVELADALYARRFWSLFRIENLIAGGIVALYLFFWLVLDPSQREAMSAVISAIDGNLVSTKTSVRYAGAFISLSVIFVAVTYVLKLDKRTMVIGLAMVIAGITATWIQARWYEHHLFPVLAAYAAWVWMIHRDIKLLWLTVLALIVAQLIFRYFTLMPHQLTYIELDRAMEEAGVSVTGKRVGILNMHPSPLNQYLARNGAWRWIGANNNAYVAAELDPMDTRRKPRKVAPPVKIDDPGRAMLHDDMLRLWEDMPPDMLILDESTSWPLRDFKVRWAKVFANDKRFMAILDQYRPIMRHKGKRMDFTIYERKD